MSTSSSDPDSVDGGDAAGDGDPAGRVYEAPRITWREPYQPLVFGISCAKVQGNPACIAPISS